MNPVAGKIMPFPRGPYDSSEIYRIIDMVSHNNKLWICKKPILQDVEPLQDDENWMLAIDGVTDVKDLDEAVTAKMAEFERQMTSAKSDISTLSTSLSNVTTRVGSAESEISSVKQSVSTANSKIASAETSISNLTSGLATANNRLSSAETSISNLTSGLATANSNISTLTTNVNNATGSISALNTRCTNLENKQNVVDAAPKDGSNNPVSSNGVYDLFNYSTDGDTVTSYQCGMSSGGFTVNNSYTVNSSDSLNSGYLYMTVSDGANGGFKIESEQINSVRSSETSFYVSDGEIRFSPIIRSTILDTEKALSQTFSFKGDAIRLNLDNETDLGEIGFKFKDIYASNGTIHTSDANDKKDIAELDSEMIHKIVMGLRPVSFKFIDGTSDRTHYGLIAQEVETLVNSLGIDNQHFAPLIKGEKVEVDSDGNKRTVGGEFSYGLRYSEFIGILVKMCQNLQNEVDELKSRLQEVA